MEYPPGIEPTRFPFPRCDSIISVWSDELVVISYHNFRLLEKVNSSARVGMRTFF